MSDETQALLDELYADLGDPQAESQALAPPVVPAGDYTIQVTGYSAYRNADDAAFAPGHPFIRVKATSVNGPMGGTGKLSFRVTTRKLTIERKDGSGSFPASDYRLFAQMRDAFGIAKDAPAGDVLDAALKYPLYAKVSVKTYNDVDRNNVDRIGAVK